VADGPDAEAALIALVEELAPYIAPLADPESAALVLPSVGAKPAINS
jgi:hypothetical protein